MSEMRQAPSSAAGLSGPGSLAWAAGLRVALIHDWLTGMRGGERVLEALCELFPRADLYTLIHDPRSVSAELSRRVAGTSWLQRMPMVRRLYRFWLPAMPLAVRAMRLAGYDLIVSSSHCVAMGATVSPEPARRRPLHVCYCHTPMRYLNYQFDNYFRAGSLAWARSGMSLFHPWLTYWDQRFSRNVDRFVANSDNVRRRIAASYGRDAEVVYPPVDTTFYDLSPSSSSREPFFLVAGALVPYKRIDIAIEACRIARAPLKIIGVGSDERRLRALARGSEVEFLGWQPAEVLRSHYQRCRALLYPQEEDFGITAVEAMACGAPVIALGKGGALETVRDGVSGLFFPEQTPRSLAAAIERLTKSSFDHRMVRAQTVRFEKAAFAERLGAVVSEAWKSHCAAESR